MEKLRDKVGGTAGDRLVLLHPGSGGLDKCLPIEAMIELFAAVRALPAAAVWMIGPDEIERFGDSWTKRLHALAPVLYHDDVREAAELACGTDVFVGYDAGMTHLAGLAGLETMAIFGPTDPRVWRPVGPACRVVAFPGEDEPHREWARRIAASLRPSVDGPG